MHIYQNNMRNKWKIVMDARIENIRQSLIRNYMVTTPYIVFHHLSIYFSSFVIKWYTACNESEKKNRACDHSVPVRIPLYRDLFFVSVAASCRHIWSQYPCDVADRHRLEPYMSRSCHHSVEQSLSAEELVLQPRHGYDHHIAAGSHCIQMSRIDDDMLPLLQLILDDMTVEFRKHYAVP